MCSSTCATPVVPGDSSIEPARYHTCCTTVGARWSSLTTRRKPLASVNARGSACTAAETASAAKMKEAFRETITANAKIPHRYSIAVCPRHSSTMLDAPSETARPSSWTARLRQGLAKTRSRLADMFGDRAVDPALYEDIEAALLASDVGVEATRLLLAGLRQRAKHARSAEELRGLLRAM